MLSNIGLKQVNIALMLTNIVLEQINGALMLINILLRQINIVLMLINIFTLLATRTALQRARTLLIGPSRAGIAIRRIMRIATESASIRAADRSSPIPKRQLPRAHPMTMKRLRACCLTYVRVMSSVAPFPPPSAAPAAPAAGEDVPLASCGRPCV